MQFWIQKVLSSTYVSFLRMIFLFAILSFLPFLQHKRITYMLLTVERAKVAMVLSEGTVV